MQVVDFLGALGADFFTGVPDSQLKAMCDFLMETYGIDPEHHIIAANEGNCAGLAAGYHLATGKIPVVYMQNSGEGNIINPVASLMNDNVYGIPCIFVIGWRGEPGIHDEPQHVYQGKVTVPLLEVMDIVSMVVEKDTQIDEIRDMMDSWKPLLDKGKQVAFVIRKGALEYGSKPDYSNDFTLNREEVLRHISKAAGEDPIVSTTGKISRELFEIREANGQGHKYDFLTVGSMGHCSSIAMGVAINKPNTTVWCIDGDGAAIMHMGAMAVIGSTGPKNMIHIVLNNLAHDTVGGMPTVASGTDMVGVAVACGYKAAARAETFEQLDSLLEDAKKSEGPVFIEVCCALGSRADLGRPTTTARENKENFMDYLGTLE